MIDVKDFLSRELMNISKKPLLLLLENFRNLWCSCFWVSLSAELLPKSKGEPSLVVGGRCNGARIPLLKRHWYQMAVALSIPGIGGCFLP